MANFVSPYITMLTLPSSLVGKSPDLNAEPHNFFYFTYILSGSYSHPYFRQCFYLGTSKIYQKCLINLVGVPTAGVSRSIDIKPGYVASGYDRAYGHVDGTSVYVGVSTMTFDL